MNGTDADAQGGRPGEVIAQADPTPPVLSNAEGLDVLAKAIAALSADDRAKLAAMLTTTGGPALSAADGKDGRP